MNVGAAGTQSMPWSVNTTARAASVEAPAMLAVRGLKKYFGPSDRLVRAVDGVSFSLKKGETLGIVGESGCGKSTLARAVLKLLPNDGGRVVWLGRDLTDADKAELRGLRQDFQIVFQDPLASLDPRMPVGQSIAEPLRALEPHLSRAEVTARVRQTMQRVGLDAAWINRYPHEFSGGQRQRICIARALALNPKFIICDESVSALDVSVQAQVLNLLKELQEEFKLTYIFISHDLSVVKFMSDRIMVMNRGRLEEMGPADRIYCEPQQAYTQQLIAAIPKGSLDTIRDRQLQRGFAIS